MILTLRLLAILGLFALSTLPFAMAGEEEEPETVIVEEGEEEGEIQGEED